MASRMGCRNSERSASLQRARRAIPPPTSARATISAASRDLPDPAPPQTKTASPRPTPRRPPCVAQAVQLVGPAHERDPAPVASVGAARGRPGRLGQPADDGLVELHRLVGRSHAELLEQVRFQPLVGHQRRTPVAPAVVRPHEGPRRLFVEGVGLDRSGRRPQRGRGVLQVERRGPQAPAGPPLEPLGPASGAFGPGCVRLVLQQLARVEQHERLAGGRRGRCRRPRRPGGPRPR